jgi:interferon-induced transmembrane protein
MAGVPDYMPWAVICTVVFCWPIGVLGIFFSWRARKLALAGDLDEARRASRAAKTSCWVSFGIGLVLLVILLSNVV